MTLSYAMELLYYYLTCMVAMALMQYLALTTHDILPYGLDNLSYYASSPGIIIPEVVCDNPVQYGKILPQ